MNFDDWLDWVDRVLISSKRGLRVKDIDETALEEAFRDGMSPVVFAQQSVLPIKIPTDHDQQTPASLWKWVVGGLVTIGVAWWARGFVLDFRLEQTLEATKYPAKLPLRGAYGEFIPPKAIEAAERSKELIRRYLLTPREVAYIEAYPIKALSTHKFLIQGIVASKNKFGVAIEADFEMELTQRVSNQEWIGVATNLGDSGDTLIWNTRQNYTGAYQQPHMAAKKNRFQMPPQRNRQ